MPSKREPMMDVANGDVGLSRHLRNSLRTLRDKTDDDEFKALADKVISGNKSLREASKSAAFSRVLNSYAKQTFDKYTNMNEEEREEQRRIGDQQLADLGRNGQRVSGEHSSEEDLDFSQRSWLR